MMYQNLSRHLCVVEVLLNSAFTVRIDLSHLFVVKSYLAPNLRYAYF